MESEKLKKIESEKEKLKLVVDYLEHGKEGFQMRLVINALEIIGERLKSLESRMGKIEEKENE